MACNGYHILYIHVCPQQKHNDPHSTVWRCHVLTAQVGRPESRWVSVRRFSVTEVNTDMDGERPEWTVNVDPDGIWQDEATPNLCEDGQRKT